MPEDPLTPPQRLREDWLLVVRLFARLRAADQAAHSWLLVRFPRTIRITDNALVWLFGVLCHPAFAVLAALLLIVGVAAGMGKSIAVSLFVSWLIVMLWVAKSKPLQRLTIPTRSVFVIAFGVLLAFGGKGLGGYAYKQYLTDRQSSAEISRPLTNPQAEPLAKTLPSPSPKVNVTSSPSVKRLRRGKPAEPCSAEDRLLGRC